MPKTVLLVMALAVVFAIGCATDEIPTEENTTMGDYERGAGGELASGMDELCPIMVRVDGYFDDAGLYDVEYDQRGQVISSSWDRDNDGAPETDCLYGYNEGQLTVVSADFDGDGVADRWSQVIDQTRYGRTIRTRSQY